MPFDGILGQPYAIGTLIRALRRSKVHHAMRFEGPDGVGKEMAAFALAQALVCTDGDPLGCGVCSACQRAVTLCDVAPHVPLHPDVVVLEKGLYPAAMLGRSRPETQDLSVDQVRSIVLERMAFAPYEGRARVFIIRGAEQLSVSAANALLKTLEEPGERTFFVLLVARPAKLLSTIRSRTLRVRFGPLADDIIVDVLAARGISRELARSVVCLCQGSVSAALALVDEELSELRGEFTERVRKALEASDSAPSLRLAETYSKNKEQLPALLQAVAAQFAQQARVAAAGDLDPSCVTGARPSGLGQAAMWAQRHALVLDALRDLERNAAPALLIENMMLRLRAEAG